MNKDPDNISFGGDGASLEFDLEEVLQIESPKSLVIINNSEDDFEDDLSSIANDTIENSRFVHRRVMPEPVDQRGPSQPKVQKRMVERFNWSVSGIEREISPMAEGAPRILAIHPLKGQADHTRIKRIYIVGMILGPLILAFVCGLSIGLVKVRRGNPVDSLDTSRDSLSTPAAVQMAPPPSINAPAFPPNEPPSGRPTTVPTPISKPSTNPPVPPGPAKGKTSTPAPTQFRQTTAPSRAPPQEPPSGEPPAAPAFFSSPTNPPVLPTLAPLAPVPPPVSPTFAPSGEPPTAPAFFIVSFPPDPPPTPPPVTPTQRPSRPPPIANPTTPPVPASRPVAPIQEVGDVPYPNFRYIPLQDLEQDTFENAMTLGYDEDSWNTPGSEGIEFYSYETIKETFSKKYIDAIDSMGFTEDVYDCWVNHYASYDWQELSGGIRNTYIALGWDSETWGSEDEGVWPETETTFWFDLTAEQRDALGNICFTEELWDRIPLPEW